MADRSVTVRLRADISNFQRGMATAGTETSAFVKRLESADSRMANLVQTAMSLTPALVPIGAAGVPALAGLTTQLGFAAVAGGTTMLAFQGVGDALGALNKAQIAPTAENMKKLNETMDALGPGGVVFVHQLQDMRDELQGLQDIAQQEILPGVNEGIESFMTQMPRFERVIATVASTLGDLTADAGADFAGPEWTEFFEYLDREAGPVLEQTGKAIGNLFEGFTNMVMAFDPLSDSFVTGLLEMSESFVAWSDGLDSSQGFQEFVRYVQESGPQAMETLGAIAGALVEFIEAAAPVGAVVLPVLEVMADALAAIADSAAGPAIIGAAAAVGTLGRSLALLSAVGLRGGGDSLIGKVLGVDKIKAGVSAMKLGQQSLYNITTASERAEMSVSGLVAARERQTVAENKRTAAMKAGAVQFGKTATAAGGLALITSGVADGMGLSNTASMAMMGTLAGPWGAAVGGGVGLLMDFAAAGDLAEQMQGSLSSAIRTAGTDFAAMDAALLSGADNVDNYFDKLSFGGKVFDALDAGLTGEAAFESLKKVQAEAEETAQATKDAFANVAMAFGEDFIGPAGESMLPTFEQLTDAAERAAPAMRALGITAEDLASMDHSELAAASDEIAAWTANADTAAGRTKAVAAAMRELDNDMIDTATAAETLDATLDALLDPSLNLSAATDAWRDGLRNLNEELDRNKGSLFENTDAASQNRSVIRDRVGDLKAILVAEANAGASSGELSKRLRTQRKALLDAGEAAGVARPQLNNYLNDLGLTPKMVRTIVKLEVAEAENRSDSIKARLDKLNAMKPSPRVDAKIAAAEAALAKVEAYLNRIDGTNANTTVTTTLRTVRAGSPGPGPQSPSGSWAGSTVPKDGGPYADRFPYLLAPGEEVISNRSGQADRNRPLLKAINAGRLADGGTAGKKDREREREEQRRRAEERRQREEERRQRRLDKQEIKSQLASDLDNPFQQSNLSVRDAQRRLQSAREANRPKSEVLALMLALKQARGDQSGLRSDRVKEQNDAKAQKALDTQEKAAQIALTAAEDQLDAAEKNKQTAKDDLEATKQLRDSLKESVAGQFNGSLTGGGLSGLMQTLRGDTAGGTAMTSTLQALKDAGLDTTGAAGGLFEELAKSNDLQTLNELLAGGPEAIEAAERAYVERDKANDERGTFVADASYGGLIEQQVAALEVAQQQYEATLQQVEQLDKVIETLRSGVNAVGQQGASFGAEINGVSSKAGKNRPKTKAKVGNWR